MSNQITVEVAWSEPGEAFLREVSVPADATVAEAIEAAGVLERVTEGAQGEVSVGIFSKRAALSDRLQPGDRVEIYRPLTVDPKEARRLRAAARNKKRG